MKRRGFIHTAAGALGAAFGSKALASNPGTVPAVRFGDGPISFVTLHSRIYLGSPGELMTLNGERYRITEVRLLDADEYRTTVEPDRIEVYDPRFQIREMTLNFNGE